MKYPAIVKNGIQTVLAFDEFSATHIEGEFIGVHSDNYYTNAMREDITHEYLTNTWGVVESKEHAEFIVELCEGAEIDSVAMNIYNQGSAFFNIYKEDYVTYLAFWDEESACTTEGEKKITIPLPPKVKEWPQVGDEAITIGGSKGILIISKPDKDGMVICDFDGEYALVCLDVLQKPKSKQELKIEELQTKL